MIVTVLGRQAHASQGNATVMARIIAIATLLAPVLVQVAHAQSFELNDLDASQDPFTFNSNNLDTIRYTRVPDAEPTHHYPERQTELLVSLKPAKPKFSLKNGFGLNMFSHAQPALEVESGQLGKNRLADAIPDLHDGFAYSAGVKVEHEDEDIDGTAYVSSGLLGLSYGRLGRMWYGGIDVNVEQFVNDADGTENNEVLSVDFTTGRRLGWTGTSSGSPLWMLSLQGNLDLQEISNDHADKGDWYLNPSLFWQNPGFTFSAQVQVPVESPSSDNTVEADYRLRAIFEKQF